MPWTQWGRCSTHVDYYYSCYNTRLSVPGVKGSEDRQLSIPAANLRSLHPPASLEGPAIYPPAAVVLFSKFVRKVLSRMGSWIHWLHS